MRIGTYNMINQVYSNSSAKKSTTTNGSGYTSFMDEISISSTAKDMQVAKAALNKTDDVRQSIVSDIKSKIDNGTYEVDPNDFAEKLLESFGANRI